VPRPAVHQRRVKLDLAEHVGEAAGTDAVIGGVVFHELRRRDDGVEGAAAST
jgi:hypothetical protein